MSKLIDKYSVVSDWDDKYILCLNENVSSVEAEILQEEGAEVLTRSLLDFIKCGRFEFETTVEGDILGASITIEEYSVIAELVDCFDEYFTEDQLIKITETEESMSDVIWDIIDKIKKQLLIQELTSMIMKVEEMK